LEEKTKLSFKKVKDLGRVCVFLSAETLKIAGNIAAAPLADRKKTMIFPLNLAAKAYQAVSDGWNASVCKHINLQLASSGIHPGTIIISQKSIIGVPNSSLLLRDRKYILIPENEYIMFLNVEHSQISDNFLIKVLWGTRILFINSQKGIETFEEIFSLAYDGKTRNKF